MKKYEFIKLESDFTNENIIELIGDEFYKHDNPKIVAFYDVMVDYCNNYDRLDLLNELFESMMKDRFLETY